MSNFANLSRAEAISVVGEAAVNLVDADNCDYTNRCMQAHEDHLVEFSASISCVDADGCECSLIAYYYQEQTDIVEAEGQLDVLDWSVHHYAVA